MTWFRDLLGRSAPRDRVANTAQDEEDLSNFRILSDYVASLLQSWTASVRYRIPNWKIWVWWTYLTHRRKD